MSIFSNFITNIMDKLTNTFGHTSFRNNVQKEAVQTLSSIFNTSDAFICLPTGGGKSLIYQLSVRIS